MIHNSILYIDPPEERLGVRVVNIYKYINRSEELDDVIIVESVVIILFICSCMFHWCCFIYPHYDLSTVPANFVFDWCPVDISIYFRKNLTIILFTFCTFISIDVHRLGCAFKIGIEAKLSAIITKR